MEKKMNAAEREAIAGMKKKGLGKPKGRPMPSMDPSKLTEIAAIIAVGLLNSERDLSQKELIARSIDTVEDLHEEIRERISARPRPKGTVKAAPTGGQWTG